MKIEFFRLFVLVLLLMGSFWKWEKDFQELLEFWKVSFIGFIEFQVVEVFLFYREICMCFEVDFISFDFWVFERNGKFFEYVYLDIERQCSLEYCYCLVFFSFRLRLLAMMRLCLQMKIFVSFWSTGCFLSLVGVWVSIALLCFLQILIILR